MATITITVSGIPETIAKLDYRPLIEIPLRNFLLKSAFAVEGKAKEFAPVDTGRLRASITSRIEETKATIAPTVHYGAHVEFGTRPHFPPPSALEPWARRHGMNAFAVARAISRRGTRRHPYMVPAAQAAAPDISRFADEFALEVETRWKQP